MGPLFVYYNWGDIFGRRDGHFFNKNGRIYTPGGRGMAYVVTKWLKMAQISKMVIFQDFSKIPNTCVLSSFYTKFGSPGVKNSHYKTKNVILRIFGNLDIISDGPNWG